MPYQNTGNKSLFIKNQFIGFASNNTIYLCIIENLSFNLSYQNVLLRTAGSDDIFFASFR
jgi:hypothetical protein